MERGECLVLLRGDRSPFLSQPSWNPNSLIPFYCRVSVCLSGTECRGLVRGFQARCHGQYFLQQKSGASEHNSI